mmetsp:Transcript_146215/g.280401  ORF Transcript_146215/g.280401 Transcript_146215/m.280401 type:complete len:321 (-) Transcript_146215:85-1047(-)
MQFIFLQGAVQRSSQLQSRRAVGKFFGRIAQTPQQRYLRNVIFTAHGVSDAGERSGIVKASGEHNGGLHLKLEKHPNHGGVGGGTNPEELLACGYAASFNAALRQCAATSGVRISGSTVTASVSLGVEQGATMVGTAPQLGLSVQVHATVAGVELAVAQKLAHLARECCPFSRAFRGGAEVVLEVEVADEASSLEEQPAAERSPPQAAPSRARHGATPRVLLVGRKMDIVAIMIRECEEQGLEAYGATSNDEVEVLLSEEGPFDACAIGFRYPEMAALQQILDAEAVPHRAMPPGTKYLSNTLEILGIDFSKDDADDDDW